MANDRPCPRCGFPLDLPYRPCPTCSHAPEAPFAARALPHHALGALGRGALFVLRDGSSRLALLVPGAVSGAASIAFFVLGAKGFDLLEAHLIAPSARAADLAGLGPACWIAFAVAYFSLVATAFLAFASTVSGPFLDRVAERAEKEVVGPLPPPERLPLPDRLRAGTREFLDASRSSLGGLALAPLALLPGIGPAFVLAHLAWSAGKAPLKRTMRRRGLDPVQREAILRRNRGAVFAYGFASLAAAAVPLAGALLAAPAANAGAPFLFARFEKNVAREPEAPSR